MAQCLPPLLKAATSGSGASALNSVCSTNACDPNLVGKQLGLFQLACQAELVTSPNIHVILTYDALYIAGPLQKAICTKDTTSNAYCLSKFSSSSTKRASLDRRDAQEVFTPDVTQWNQKNVAFLGITGNLSQDQLCVPCTRLVISAYTTQLGNTPYAPGLQNTQLLGSEQALFNAITSKCGASFLNGQAQAAGGLATGAAPRSADGGFALVGSAFAAAAVGAAALL